MSHKAFGKENIKPHQNAKIVWKIDRKVGL